MDDYNKRFNENPSVADISIENGFIELYFPKQKKQYEYIEIAHRKTKHSMTFPFERNTRINTKEDFGFTEGIWDVYLIHNGKRKRVSCSELNDNMTSELTINNRTFEVLPYQTINGNLSFHFNIKIADFHGMQVEKERDNVFIVQLNYTKTTDIQKIRATHRRSGTNLDGEIIDVKDGIHCRFDFHANDQYGVWDIFLNINDIWYELFVPNTSRSTAILKDKSEYDEEDVLFTWYCNNRRTLSLNRKKPSIIRDVELLTLKGKKLHLNGYCYIEGVEKGQESKRELVVTHRESHKYISYDLNDFSIKKNYSIDSLLAYYFSVQLNLFSVLKKLGESDGILDFYIVMEHDGKKYKRKLGMQKFHYTKDDFIDKSTSFHPKGIVDFYASYTPAGNIKIEVIALPILHRIIGFLSVFLYYFHYRHKDIWIIGERQDTAQDTGYHFFKYCRETFPEKNIYYAIDGESKDVKNIVSFGNVLRFGTFKHYLYTLMATTIMSSHDNEYFLPFKGKYFHTYRRATKVFLQHGVLGRKHAEYDKKYYEYPFDIFCVSSKGEKEMVINKLGYSKNNVFVTGLSRFDELHHAIDEKKEPVILLMPTWREWLNTDDEFIKSDYFHRYQSLINDPNLMQILNEYNAKLIFYPHYRAQPFLHHFKRPKLDRVEFIELGAKSVQYLLQLSDVLITDYSSVSFDVSYMNKPVLFYHFDFDTFFKKGILRPPHETFLGDICHDKYDLIHALTKILENNCEENESVKDNKKNIFEYVDDQNSKRIYDAIVSKNRKKQSMSFSNIITNQLKRSIKKISANSK